MKDYYVILTGSKNNAGDFLIKYRAKELFKSLRPDRDIVDIDAWKPLDDSSLNVINGSKSLILMGGPALRYYMYPRIYPLRQNLDDITTPITTMGIGWNSADGNWKDTYDYPISPESLALLRKCNDSGLTMSVRDYHTLNILNQHGFGGAVMTGCPAYYDLPRMEGLFTPPGGIARVAFSLGISFMKSASMARRMRTQILWLRDYFSDAKFDVIFHHGYGLPDGAGNDVSMHDKQHRDFFDWLRREGINTVDVSGSAESMMKYYTCADIHIGYRVHAHIFMTSISKPTILLAEDGRGKAVANVAGGMVVDAYDGRKDGIILNICSKIGLQFDRYIVNENDLRDIEGMVDYEKLSNWQRTRSSRAMVATNFEVMKEYIRSLP